MFFNGVSKMNVKNPKVDEFLRREGRWQKELSELRRIVLDCPLDEQLKWGVPCYTNEDKNIVLIHGFKEYCALLFMKGSVMSDPDGILITQTENVQFGRQIRFTDVQQIIELEPVLKKYIMQAIEVEKAGIKVPVKKTEEFKVTEEFQKKLEENPVLATAFKNLTPGRQRGYLLYFSAPKQSATREARIEKCVPQILAGKGLND
jgi:uncharacterized protein YdeI (YjbR/CyaY-like superfamily)